MERSTPKKSPIRKPPPPHLSEFYSFVNGNLSSAGSAVAGPESPTRIRGRPDGSSGTESATETFASYSRNMDSPSFGTPSSPTRGSSSQQRRLTNNTYRSESMLSMQSSLTPSTLDLETVITKKDVQETVKCCQDLIRTSAAYKEAMITLSTAASEFGRALEDCARCKGAGKASEGLMTSSGLHYQIANHQQILSHAIDTNFQQPVKKIVTNFEKTYQENETNFKINIKDKVRQLRQHETANIKLSKKKTRNIIAYKSNLLQLASQLDEIDRLKHDYYVSSFDQVQDSFLQVLGKTCSIVSMETTMYENIAKKAWSGGGIDGLLDEYCRGDPFDERTDDDTKFGRDIDTDVSGTASATIKDNQSVNEPIPGSSTPPQQPIVTEQNDVTPTDIGLSHEESGDISDDEVGDETEPNETNDTFYSPPIVNRSYGSNASSNNAPQKTESDESADSKLKNLSVNDNKEPHEPQDEVANELDEHSINDQSSTFSLPTATSPTVPPVKPPHSGIFASEWAT